MNEKTRETFDNMAEILKLFIIFVTAAAQTGILMMSYINGTVSDLHSSFWPIYGGVMSLLGIPIVYSGTKKIGSDIGKAIKKIIK